MNKKVVVFMIIFSALGTGAFAQVKEGIHKAARDPKRAENAAQADVRQVKGGAIFDSVSVARRDSAVPVKKKKKKCRSTQ